MTKRMFFTKKEFIFSKRNVDFFQILCKKWEKNGKIGERMPIFQQKNEKIGKMESNFTKKEEILWFFHEHFFQILFNFLDKECLSVKIHIPNNPSKTGDKELSLSLKFSSSPKKREKKLDLIPSKIVIVDEQKNQVKTMKLQIKMMNKINTFIVKQCELTFLLMLSHQLILI